MSEQQGHVRDLDRAGVTNEEAEARDWMRCMAYTNKGHRCTRRYTYGTYNTGRYVMCVQHARLAGWEIW